MQEERLVAHLRDRPALLKENEMLSAMASRGLFKLLKKGKRTYSFINAKKG